MSISSISFGAKIPVAKCQVLDKRENKFINATVYEYDCKDLEDIFEVGDLDESWEFQDLYTSSMHKKYIYQRDGRGDTGLSFYCLKNSDDEMLGVCQTEEKKR